MGRDEWMADAAIRTEDGTEWTLKYYVRVSASENEEPVYGISIEKYTGNGLLTETNSTPAFTGSYPEAAGLAERFARGTVTPCVLAEMTDEWVC